MRNFGSTGASSLLRSATAAQNKAQTYQDAEAAANWDASAKDSAALKQYQDYLNGRVSSIKNSDPSKALSLTRTLTTAQRDFNSAEIGRMSQQVQFGNMSNRDKYGAMNDLYQKAINSGDYNNAQKIGEQMSSLSITIQNEEKANADAATAASNKAAAATKKQYTDAIDQNKMGIDQLNALRDAGKVTPAEYENQMAQFYQGSGKPDPNNLATYGIANLTKTLAQNEAANGSPNGTYNRALVEDGNIKKYSNDVAIAKKTGMDNSQVITPNGDGTYSFHNRPQSEVVGSTPIIDPKTGLPIPGSSSQTYALPQGFADKSGNVNGIQLVGNIKNGKFAPGTGPGALYQYGGNNIFHDDKSGVPYIILPNGAKKFIGFEAKTDANGNKYNQAITGNKPEDIKNMPGVTYGAGKIGKTNVSGSDNGATLGPFANPFTGAGRADITSGISQVGKIFKAGRNIPVIGGTMGLVGGALDGLFARSNAAQAAKAQADLEARVAAQNAAKDAATLAAQRQNLLAVRSAPPPLPPPPKITARPSQYNLPPLPAPVPVTPQSNFKVPASTGNYQKDVTNLGESLLTPGYQT